MKIAVLTILTIHASRLHISIQSIHTGVPYTLPSYELGFPMLDANVHRVWLADKYGAGGWSRDDEESSILSLQQTPLNLDGSGKSLALAGVWAMRHS